MSYSHNGQCRTVWIVLMLLVYLTVLAAFKLNEIFKLNNLLLCQFDKLFGLLVLHVDHII